MSGTKIEEIKSQINEVKSIMIENIEKTVKRGDNLQDLLIKSEDLERDSKVFVNRSTKLKKFLYCKNIKLIIIIISVVILILAIIGLIIYFQVK